MKLPARGRVLVVIWAMANASLAVPSQQLRTAAREGDLEGVRAALVAGAQIGAKAKDGATALFYAARYGHPEVVEFLAERGAEVNIVAAIDVGGRAYRVTAIGAAALGGYADTVRVLLKYGADVPEFTVGSDRLVSFASGPGVRDAQRRGSDTTFALRDWEVVATILRTPEVEAITHEIVLLDAQGIYRSHDGQQYEVWVEDGSVTLVASSGSVAVDRLQSVGGTRFAQGLLLDSERRPAGERRESTGRGITMLTRWLQRLPPEERDRLVQQYVEQGGVWLDFIIGQGQVLGFNFRDGGPRDLGGPPVLFRKLNTRPTEWPSAGSDAAPTRPEIQPMNWPAFRGPRASGVADRQFPPSSWDVEQSINIRWKTPIPGLGNSSPIVWGDKIFITTAISSRSNPVFRPGNMGDTDTAGDRSEHVWRLYCLDRLTGQILWERTVHKGVPRAGRHLKSTFANPTPVTDGEYVITFFGPEGLYCYDMEGDLIWQKDFGFVGMPAWGFASSPIIYRDTVIVQADTPTIGRALGPGWEERLRGQPIASSFIAAFDLADGSERWRTARDEDAPSFGTPTVYEAPGRPQLITNGGERIRAYDPMTGNELWSFTAGTRNVTPTPIVAHDLIFVTSGFRPIQPIYAIRPNAAGDISLAEGDETNEFIAWSKNRGGSYTPTPIVYGEYLYAVNVSGILACYEAKTGKRMYRARLRHMGGGMSSSPVASDGRVYFSSEDGDVFVIKAGPEFELLATNSMAEVIMATPAISGGMIFIRTLHHLFGIG